ncbi:potassium transporter TrkA [Salinibacter sp. 10B]|uniref:potassium channel family protein n=1 Tax=Salinibacter sp. 10B TaxID=1923971 RepID=UPI000CF5055F|nr:TrkA family potassium uptake protein [Salinibacter sp. 10B]PQJ35198.1 potassium transporter TrkA [Salinibacter sp. 10B]
MKRFVIVGLGNFGSSVAEALYSRGHDVIAVDTDERAVDNIAPHCSRAAVGDGRQRETLEEVGAGEADAAVVSTGDDITASILATMALTDLGIENVYAKVISHNHARVMVRLGVTETVFPERESGYNLASRISEKGVLNYVRMARNLSVQELVVPDDWRGRTLRDLEVRAQFGVSVVGIHDTTNDEMIVPPDPDETLERTDTLLLAGPDDALEAVAELANETAT